MEPISPPKPVQEYEGGRLETASLLNPKEHESHHYRFSEGVGWHSLRDVPSVQLVWAQKL